jgi:hypothetical protein
MKFKWTVVAGIIAIGIVAVNANLGVQAEYSLKDDCPYNFTVFTLPPDYYFKGVAVTEMTESWCNARGLLFRGINGNQNRIVVLANLSAIDKKLALAHEYCHSMQTNEYFIANPLQAEKDCYLSELYII